MSVKLYSFVAIATGLTLFSRAVKRSCRNLCSNSCICSDARLLSNTPTKIQFIRYNKALLYQIRLPSHTATPLPLFVRIELLFFYG